MLCDQKQSLQQLIFNLYTTLHLTQLKGYSVMQYSWMLLQTYEKGIVINFACYILLKFSSSCMPVACVHICIFYLSL